MPASNRYMNWTGVAFTPDGGSLTSITGVTNLRIQFNGNNTKFYGDGDIYPSTIAHSQEDLQITITAASVAALLALPGGTRGTLVATLNDARNKEGTGAITFTIVGCVIRSPDVGAQYRQFSAPTLMIDVEVEDGLTNPVSTSIAA